MNDKIIRDLDLMRERLKKYVKDGTVTRFGDVREEPVIAVKPEKSKIHPLRKTTSCDACFMAVDCSTRT
jgi:hypothetical protein